MAIWIAIVLGVIQGLTEFLPLSSSGHLLLVEHFLSVPTSMFFNLLMHLATLVAVILFFWKDVLFCLKHPLSKQTLCLILSSFCTATIAFAMSFLPGVFEGMLLGPSFLVTAIVLLVSELWTRRKKTSFAPISTTKAFVVGVAQGIAVLPGISRSGSTISTLKFMGMDNQSATSYSFLLSIPVIVGGIVLEITTGSASNVKIGIWPCLLGFVFSFLFGLASLFFLKKLVKNNKWWVFVPYLFVLGTLVTIWQYA